MELPIQIDTVSIARGDQSVLKTATPSACTTAAPATSSRPSCGTLHDCRARNVIEAIMWHGSAQSDARWTVERFRQLSKADRDAVVKFINAI